jgi:hypothetical protein
MRIIFDEKLVPELQTRYIVLELDTVMQPAMEKPLTLYALIEDLDINILTNLVDLSVQHAQLIKDYKDGNWDAAEINANALMGSWRNSIDEFYELVIQTCKEYRSTNTTWNGIRYTTPSEE